MSENKGEPLKEFEAEYDEVLHLVVVDQSFFKNRKRITSFIEYNTASCTDLINSQQFKSCLYMLNKLYSICVEILRTFPIEMDSQGTIRSFFTQLKVKEKATTTGLSQNKGIDIPNLIYTIQNFITLKDITELKSPDWFQYSLIMEYFLVNVNNLAYINLKRNKYAVSIELLQKAMECCNLIPACSYYLKYHLSSIVINLVYLVEDNYRDGASQLLCNTALYLEKLEKELDSHVQSQNIYEFLDEKAFNFVIFVEMKEQSFGQKSYKNPKSFLLARMCFVMAYYGDLLSEQGHKHEADIARDHTKELEQQLLKNEKQKFKSQEEENIERNPKRTLSNKKENDDNEDNKSTISFKSAKTGMTAGTMPDEQHKISKENIIYQKYVSVSDVKFKIIMIHMRELQAIQVMVYSKPRNMLQKVFVHFEEVLEYAREHGINLAEDKDANKILTKVAKLMYFKDNELLFKDINFFKSVEELKTFALQKNA